MMTRAAAIVAILALALPLGADALSDLRAALAARFAGQQPLRAHVELHRSRHASGRFITDDFEGSAAADVEQDGSELRMRVARPLLKHAAEDDWAHQLDPHHDEGTVHAVAELVPESVAGIIDFAPELERFLGRARLVAPRSPRMLVIDLPPSTGSSDLGSISFREDRLTLWLGADGLPVSAQRVRKGSAGILFIHIESTRTERWSLAAHGDHLLVTRLDDASVVNGPGERGEARTIWTVSAQ